MERMDLSFPSVMCPLLPRHLEVLADNESLRHRMGQVSRSIIETFSPENWANGVMQAIESMINVWIEQVCQLIAPTTGD